MSESSRIGTTLQGISIEANFGRDELGILWRGFDEREKRNVILHLLSGDLVQDQKFVARYLRAVRVAESLEHPNIIQTFGPFHDATGAESLRGMVCELAEGEALSEVLLQRPSGALEEDAAIQVVLGLARALNHGHRREIFHGALALDKVIVTSDFFRVTLLDFGILSTLEEPSTPRRLTRGVARFQAPERFAGAPASDAADVYALGCLFFTLLYGVAPFAGESLAELKEAHATTELRFATGLGLRSEAILQRLIRAMCAKNPSARQDLPSLIASLEHILGTTPPSHASISSIVSMSGEGSTPTSGISNTFIGRDVELDAIAKAFRNAARLVTLHGSAGIGKSRLALEFLARQHQARSFFASLYVPLRGLTSSDDLRHAIGVACGLSGESRSSLERIRATLRARPATLLLLDNAEHLLEPLAPLLFDLIEAAPSLKVLVTSQLPIDLAAEIVISLGPLTGPASQFDDPQSNPARQLFIARLSEAGATQLYWDHESEVALQKLLALLDGVPLAIELAAAKGLNASPPELLACYLEDTLELDPLKRSIAWAWRRLSPVEVEACRQISFLSGDFNLEALEAILDFSEHEQDTFIIDLVEDLVAKSLLRAAPHPDLAGELRLSMLGPIADFARHAGQSPSAATASAPRGFWNRVAAYFVPLAEGLEKELALHPLRSTVVALSSETHHLLAIHQHFLGTDLVLSLRALLSVDRQLMQDGRSGQVLTAYQRVFEVCQEVKDFTPQLRALIARAFASHANALRLLGRSEEGLTIIEAGTRFLESSLGLDVESIRRAAFDIEQSRGNLLYALGRGEEGLAHHPRFARFAKGVGDEAAVAYIQANFLILLGKISEALVPLKIAEDRCRAGGLDHTLARVSNSRGIVLAGLGRHHEALKAFDEVREIARQHLDSDLYRTALSNAAGMYCLLGEHLKAKSAHESVARLCESIGDLHGQAIALGGLGEVELELGAYEAAERGLERAIAVAALAKADHVAAYFAFPLGQTKLLRALAIPDENPRRALLQQACESLGPIVEGATAFHAEGSADFGLALAGLALAYAELGKLGDDAAQTRASATYQRACAERKTHAKALEDDHFRCQLYDQWLARLAVL